MTATPVTDAKNVEIVETAARPRREWGLSEELLLVGYAEAVAS